MSMVCNLERIGYHTMKNFFVRTLEEDKQSVNLPRNKLRKYLELTEIILSHPQVILKSSDPIWSNLIRYDPIWSNLIQSNPNWSNLIQSDPHKFTKVDFRTALTSIVVKKEQFNPDLESFRRPWLGTQGPVSGQSRISETGTTTAYWTDNFIF